MSKAQPHIVISIILRLNSVLILDATKRIITDQISEIILDQHLNDNGPRYNCYL